MTGRRILVRADASPSGGIGHVMRCVGLAQELASRGATVSFASRSLTPFAEDRLRLEGFAATRVDSQASLTELVARTNPDWTILDLGAEFEPAEMLDVTSRVLVVDDFGQSFLTPPDLVLNQNLHATHAVYAGVDDDRVLRGPTYLLFRDEFLRALSTRDDTRRSGVLLSLGGTDPLRLTLPFAEAMLALLDRPLLVLASSKHPDIARLRELGIATPRLRLYEDVSDVTGLMSQVDLAVTSGGTTVWELAALGVPCLVGSAAPIEELLLAGLRERGLFDVLGPLEVLDPDQLAARVCRRLADRVWLSQCRHLARGMVDGHGRRRVAAAMEHRN